MLKRYGWMCYDHLGGVVLYNVLWSVLNLPYLACAYAIAKTGFALGPWGAVGGGVLAVVVAFFSPPSTLVYWACAAWVRRQEVGLGDALRSLKGFYLRAQLLQLALLAISATLVLNAAFYSDFAGWWGLFLGALMAWLLLGLTAVALYILPLLVTQDTGMGETLRKSALLAVAHAGGSLFQCAVFGVFLVVGAFSGVGMFCGVFTAWSLWMSLYMRGVLMRYTGEEWDEEAPRSLREILRPWES